MCPALRLLAASTLAFATLGCLDSNDPQPSIIGGASMEVLGSGTVVPGPAVAEVAVQGTTAYTTTWSFSPTNPGNRIDIWDVSGVAPVRVSSIVIGNASAVTLGDVAIDTTGATPIMIVATERGPGMIVVYDISAPRTPVELSRFNSANTQFGVHTAKLGRTPNGRLYAFLAADPGSGFRGRTVIVDLTDPAAPVEVHVRQADLSIVHDTFYRDGYLFIAQWNDGVVMLDIGVNGTVTNPIEVMRLQTAGGNVHNVWWYKQAGSSAPGPYLFVGEEGPGGSLSSSSGDVHVVEINPTTFAAQEVAFYDGGNTVGPHNFWMDEPNGVLYSAFYNGGVRALDVRGDLGACTQSQRAADGRCSLGAMGREIGRGLQDDVPVYVWGVRYVLESPTQKFVYASDMLGRLWKLRGVDNP